MQRRAGNSSRTRGRSGDLLTGTANTSPTDFASQRFVLCCGHEDCRELLLIASDSATDTAGLWYRPLVSNKNGRGFAQAVSEITDRRRKLLVLLCFCLGFRPRLCLEIDLAKIEVIWVVGT